MGLADISNFNKSSTSIFINSNIVQARQTVDRKDDKKGNFRPTALDHFEELTVIKQQSARIGEQIWRPHASTSYSFFTEQDDFNPDLILLTIVLQHGEYEQEMAFKIH